MRCTAKYCGEKEKFGVCPGEVHPVELNMYRTEHGSPYIWIQALDNTDYLMPFSSLTAMFGEWMFEERGDEEERQRDVEECWMGMYLPDEAVIV